MTFWECDEPPNAVDQYASELLVARAYPDELQGRSRESRRYAARILQACLGLMVLIGLASGVVQGVLWAVGRWWQ